MVEMSKAFYGVLMGALVGAGSHIMGYQLLDSIISQTAATIFLGILPSILSKKKKRRQEMTIEQYPGGGPNRQKKLIEKDLKKLIKTQKEKDYKNI